MKKFVAWVLIFLMFSSNIARAQALPVSAVSRAISGVIQSKMLSRGFAANDPRFLATVSGAGSQIVGAATAAAVVTAAGITAPAWVTVGATVALGSVFAYGISLAADKTMNWLFNSDGTVNAGKTASPAGSPVVYVRAQGAALTMDTIVSNSIGKQFIVITNQNPTYYKVTYFSTPTNANPAPGTYTLSQGYNYNGTYYYVWVTPTTQQTTVCPTGYTLSGSNCVANAQPVSESVTDAASALTNEQLDKDVNPELVAKLAQAAWEKAASQPGYQGVPVDATKPITEADAKAYQDANPATWPKVRDVVKPQPATSGDPVGKPFELPVPSATPGSSGGTGGDSTGGSTTAFDWSILPTGETIPKTDPGITFSPIPFAAPTGCPASVTFEIFGRTFAVSYTPFCDFLTTINPLIVGLGAVSAAIIFARSLKP
jgi:hypothetical protein